MRQFLLYITTAVILSGCCNYRNLTVYDTRCENLRNPLGIDKTSPRFSWKVRSNKNGTEQKAYQLIVASDLSLLAKNHGDLWNSGKVQSPSSILVPYEGSSLGSGTVAYWKVRIWDETGKASPWSPVSEFSIGLLNAKDWQASYIGFPSEKGFSGCPQLRKSFMIDKTGGRVFLHVNSLGYHEVYLNGKKVGDGVLVPAVSQFNKRSLVLTYDLTSLVRNGRNDLVLWLGSGWYSEGLPGVYNKGSLVKAQVEGLSGNKRKIIVATDSSWAGRNSSYTRIGTWHSGNFGGEEIDGTLAKKDLSGDDRQWYPVKEIEIPCHEVSPQMAESNRVSDTIKPAAIVPFGEKTFLVDMGKNLSGWVEVHFPPLKKSQVVQMDYCDHLDEKGQFVDQKQVDRYIASGEGEEIFKNKFNYHGFRYIRISNLEAIPDIDSIRGYLIHTGYDLASDFQCSDPDLNEIHNMVFYTLRCLSLGGYLVDCPQIERLGYGGDGNASTMTAQTMFNLAPFYCNWLQAWDDCIRDDGGMPHTAPNPYNAGGGPYWCGFIITASWNTYLNYGDTLILKKYYPTMQKWLGYVDKYTVNGLLKRWPDTDYRSWYLGDWASPTGVDQTATASVDLVNNCFIAVCYDCMQKIATVLGKQTDAEHYSVKRDQVRKTIHQAFFNPLEQSYATGTQIDLTYPLLAGVVPAALTDPVTKNLIREMELKRNGHIACGLVGIPVFTEWTVRNQAVDLMYTILKKRDYPGYLYMIDHGATTTWEHWNGERSRIHNCYNGIGSWFYQSVGGIRPEENIPAYRKVVIQPQIPNGMTWARTSKETPYGTIKVNWKLKGHTMDMDLQIPVGTDAEVIMPSGTKRYGIGGKQYTLSDGTPSVIHIKSGSYKISYGL